MLCLQERLIIPWLHTYLKNKLHQESWCQWNIVWTHQYGLKEGMIKTHEKHSVPHPAHRLLGIGLVHWYCIYCFLDVMQIDTNFAFLHHIVPCSKSGSTKRASLCSKDISEPIAHRCFKLELNLKRLHVLHFCENIWQFKRKILNSLWIKGKQYPFPIVRNFVRFILDFSVLCQIAIENEETNVFWI